MERLIENAMYAARWLLAPIYFGLSLALLALVLKFFQEVFHVLPRVFELAEIQLILVLLSLVDMALVGGLLVMVMISGYENFVSHLNIAEGKDKLDWLGKMDAGSLKLKVGTSIVAISSIHLLRMFMDAEQVANDKLFWYVIIHMTFVLSTHVRNRAGQAAIPHHAGHVQILDPDHRKSAGQARGELVQSILADAGDPGVQPCQSGAGLLGVGRTLLLATQTAGQPAQAFEQGAVCLRPGDHLAGRERSQRGHPQVNTDRALVFGFGQVRQVLGVRGDAGEPAVGHATDRRRDNLAGEAQRLPHPHPAEVGDADAAAVESELVVGQGEAVMHTLAAEPRVLGPAGEEVLEGIAELDDRHLRCVLGDFQHPGELLALDRVELPAQRRLRWLGQRRVGLVRRVLPTPLGQRPVVGEPRHTRRAGEVGRLCVVRVEGDLVGNEHGLVLAGLIGTVTAPCCFSTSSI